MLATTATTAMAKPIVVDGASSADALEPSCNRKLFVLSGLNGGSSRLGFILGITAGQYDKLRPIPACPDSLAIVRRSAVLACARWYLVYQAGPPMFSTADRPDDPTRWTAPAPFFATTPGIIDKNGGWLDFWVICDAGSCHPFFSDDKGRFYRSTTSVEQFPRGFSEPVVVMADAEAARLYEACNVYKLKSSGKFLALIEAFDQGSESRRYFRSFTADKLDGAWTVLHDGAASPFAGERNVAFAGAPWTRDISHGELIRAGYDETLLLDDTTPLRYLFQGFPPNASTDDYGAIPWSLGLLTQKPGG